MIKDFFKSIEDAHKAPSDYEQAYENIVSASLISITKEYPEKEYALFIDDVPAFPMGDISLIHAQAKQGKTSLEVLLVGAMLSGNIGCLKRATERELKICVFDTEQDECNTSRHYKMMMQYGGLDMKKDSPLLRVYNMRKYSFDDRLKNIFCVIEHERPQVVFIDGIRDLITDINDPVCCPELVQDMMRIASEYQCAIIGALHNNPTDNKARGWLGTEWINKCGSAFELNKRDNVARVSNSYSRGLEAEDFYFTWDNEGYPTFEGVNTSIFFDKSNKERESAKNKKELTRLSYITEILKENNGEMRRSDLVKSLVEKSIVGFGQSTIQNLIKEYLEKPESERMFYEEGDMIKLVKSRDC